MINGFYIKDIFDGKMFLEIHEGSLKILEETGVKFYSDEILHSLKNPDQL